MNRLMTPLVVNNFLQIQVQPYLSHIRNNHQKRSTNMLIAAIIIIYEKFSVSFPAIAKRLPPAIYQSIRFIITIRTKCKRKM